MAFCAGSRAKRTQLSGKPVTSQHGILYAVTDTTPRVSFCVSVSEAMQRPHFGEHGGIISLVACYARCILSSLLSSRRGTEFQTQQTSFAAREHAQNSPFGHADALRDERGSGGRGTVRQALMLLLRCERLCLCDEEDTTMDWKHVRRVLVSSMHHAGATSLALRWLRLLLAFFVLFSAISARKSLNPSDSSTHRAAHARPQPRAILSAPLGGARQQHATAL